MKARRYTYRYIVHSLLDSMMHSVLTSYCMDDQQKLALLKKRHSHLEWNTVSSIGKIKSVDSVSVYMRVDCVELGNSSCNDTRTWFGSGTKSVCGPAQHTTATT